MDNEIIRFVSPFKKKIKKKISKNIMEFLNSSIFSKNENIDFSYIGLNSEFKSCEFKIPEEYEILKLVNKEKMIYYYILKSDDFILDLEQNFENEKNSEKKKNFENFENENLIFLFPEKYYIFKTFYPFSSNFEIILQEFYKNLKKKKIDKLMKIKSGTIITKNILNIISYHNIFQEEKNLITKISLELQKTKITSNFEKKINFKINQNVKILKIPSKEKSGIIEADCLTLEILKKLTFEEFFLILNLLYLEKSVVFISNEKKLISGSISLFLKMLYPFYWVFPIIYSLPEEYISLLESPVPIIAGVNISSYNFYNEILKNLSNTSQRNCVFVFLDKDFIFMDFEFMKEIISPEFNDIIKTFKMLYRKIYNPVRSKYLNVFSFNDKKDFKQNFVIKNKKYLQNRLYKIQNNIKLPTKNSFIDYFRKLAFNKSQEKDKFKIFTFFSFFFEDFILSKLYYYRYNLDNKQIVTTNDIDVNSLSLNPRDRLFLKEFMSTQLFTDYFENFFMKS